MAKYLLVDEQFGIEPELLDSCDEVIARLAEIEKECPGFRGACDIYELVGSLSYVPPPSLGSLRMKEVY